MLFGNDLPSYIPAAKEINANNKKIQLECWQKTFDITKKRIEILQQEIGNILRDTLIIVTEYSELYNLVKINLLK